MKRGFTFIEILLVVAIIALLAALAIPNFLRAHIEANESVTQAALKAIATAEITYRTANPNYGTLPELGTGTAPYIDNVLAAGTKNGYSFNIIVGTEQFVTNAVPSNPGRSGVRNFCITEDGTIRVSTAISAATDHDTCQTYPEISQ